MKNKKLLNYSDYLQLEKILSGQELMSAKRGTPAHDEMLFIIVHQVYELWFKQILHELDSVITIFRQESIIESEISFVVLRLQRIIEIQKILIDQIRVLETMTAMDFLEFRDDLFLSIKQNTPNVFSLFFEKWGITIYALSWIELILKLLEL